MASLHVKTIDLGPLLPVPTVTNGPSPAGLGATARIAPPRASWPTRGEARREAYRVVDTVRVPAPEGAEGTHRTKGAEVEVDLSDPALYVNRELSWLEFNDRCLAQAFDWARPLLERVRFLSICASMLDEYYQVRFA